MYTFDEFLKKFEDGIGRETTFQEYSIAKISWLTALKTKPYGEIDSYTESDGLSMAQSFMNECYAKFLKKANDHNRTLTPWKNEPSIYLEKRLLEEVNELFTSNPNNPEEIMGECLDIANFAWFIYEQAKIKLEKEI